MTPSAVGRRQTRDPFDSPDLRRAEGSVDTRASRDPRGPTTECPRPKEADARPRGTSRPSVDSKNGIGHRVLRRLENPNLSGSSEISPLCVPAVSPFQGVPRARVPRSTEGVILDFLVKIGMLHLKKED